MADLESVSLSVYPEVELSDSEDELPFSRPKPKPEKLGMHPDITEDDLKGFPPLLLGNKNSDSSDSDSEGENNAVNGSAGKGSGVKSIQDKLRETMERKQKFTNKLRELHLKRNEARKLNHQEVAAEDQRKKLPKNYEARRLRAEWELEEQEAKKQAEELGDDYERKKLLEETADEVDMKDKRKRKKQRPDEGFSDYATAQKRQYDRLTKQMKPNVDEYAHKKEKLGENAFPAAHNLGYGGDGECSEAAVDRMVEDLEKQIDKRSKFHRRRQHYDESNIDYINDRNAKFNQKAERFYGQYTQEIKQNLERGTAI